MIHYPHIGNSCFNNYILKIQLINKIPIEKNIMYSIAYILFIASTVLHISVLGPCRYDW